MKLLVTLLVALVLILGGCGAAEEPVADTDTEAVVEETEVIEEEVVEIVEEVVVVGQLPEPWPEDLLLPEGLVVIEETVNDDGYPLLITQFEEGVEPLTMSEMFNHFFEAEVNPNWEVPFPDQQNALATSAFFHVDIYHSEHRYIVIDGFNDVETGIPTVELYWLSH